MKQQIRFNTFETNSSTTHNITIFSEEEYEKFKAGEIFVDYDGFVTKDEILNSDDFKEHLEMYMADNGYEPEELEEITEDAFNDYCYENGVYGNETDSELEEDINTYTTKSGEKLYIICRYGHDY